MANWCAIDMHIVTASEDDAQKLFAAFRRQKELAREEDRMVFVGSKDRYMDDFCYDICGNEVVVTGDVKWCIDDNEMKEIVAWLQSLVAVVSIECELDESGCSVFGYYRYKDGKLTYTYIPLGEYPQYEEDDDSWYDKLLHTLEVAGVTEEVE